MGRLTLSPKLAYLLVSLALGQLGDGLNIFQGIYLVGMGWNEGSVGIALSLMGLTALIIQPWAGDWVDKTVVDRRLFLAAASCATALSASSVLFVKGGGPSDRVLVYATKIAEGAAASFLGPCLAALTLATFGPHHFDAVMASNILWGHVGSVAAAVLAGYVSFVLYPRIKYCFLVIGASAVLAIFLVGFLPQGDPLMGRGFAGKVALDEEGHVERLQLDDEEEESAAADVEQRTDPDGVAAGEPPAAAATTTTPEAASYTEVFADVRTVILSVTGFFYHFANANVLLVLGELMGQDKQNGGQTRSAIPLVAGAIVAAQITMAAATYAGDKLTLRGVGRKPLFLAALASLPVRCALIVWWKDAGHAALLSTQVFDGLGGGLFALVHPYLVADITFGTGRFNVLMGLTASCFGLGATLSNFLGQMVVEKFGHVTSLLASLVLSLVPVVLFLFMPETLGMRTRGMQKQQQVNNHHETIKLVTAGNSYGSTDSSSVSSSP